MAELHAFASPRSLWPSLLLVSLGCSTGVAGLTAAPRKESNAPVVEVPVAQPPTAESTRQARDTVAPSEPRERLATLTADGRVSLRAGKGALARSFDHVPGAELTGARAMACSEQHVFVATSETLLRSYAGSDPRRADNTVKLSLPNSALCAPGYCFVRELRASLSGQTACLELTDGSPSTANGTVTFVAQFDSNTVSEGICPLELNMPPERELPGCVMTTPGGKVQLDDQAACWTAQLGDSDDGRYSAVGIASTCGDYCYMDVVLLDKRQAALVGEATSVAVGTPVHWAKSSSEVIIGLTLIDLGSGSRRALEGEACWLGVAP